MKFDLVIKNGTVVRPGGSNLEDIGVKDGRIAAFSQPESLSGVKEIDEKGLNILPGIIHTHVHMREPGMTHK